MKNIKKNCIISTIAFIGGIGFSGLIIAEDVANDVAVTGPIPFATLDVNHDGVVSADEYRNARESRKIKQSQTGRPHLGALSAPTFEDIDTNKDQRITQQELTAARNKQAYDKPLQQTQIPAQKNKMFSQSSRPTNQEMRGRGPMPTFGEFDLDNDGQITQQEMTKAREIRQTARQEGGKGRNQKQSRVSFADLDVDNNGYVSAAEFKQHQVEVKRYY